MKSQMQIHFITPRNGILRCREKKKETKKLIVHMDNLHSKETATIPRYSYNYLMDSCNGNKILLSKAKKYKRQWL